MQARSARCNRRQTDEKAGPVYRANFELDQTRFKYPLAGRAIALGKAKNPDASPHSRNPGSAWELSVKRE